MKHNNQYNFTLLLSAENSTHNAPFSTQKLKKNSEEGAQTPPHWEGVWDGAVKHRNQYNFRLLQSAKIAHRMRQNTPFST